MKPPIYSERIVTFSVIYHPYRRNTERFVRAFGAFEVNLQPGDDVLFTRHHHTYPDKDRTAPLLEMTKLLDQQTDCVCAILEAPGSSHRPKSKADFAKNVLEALPIFNLGLHRKIHVHRTEDQYVRVSAELFGITLASKMAGPSEKSRRAADHAQALWLSWVFNCLAEDPDQASLVAAFQAWRRVDDLRPVTF